MSVVLALVLLTSIILSSVGCNFGHVHEFVLSESESTRATCLAGGIEVKVCSCGDRQEQPVPALGHDMKVVMDVKPSCTRPGSEDRKCTNCGKMEYKNLEPLGHSYEETPSEPSRVIRCTNEGCLNCMWGTPNDKHKETLTFNFTKEDEAAIDAKYDEVLALIEAAAEYDPALQIGRAHV